ncbi:MAG: chorismate mutase [Planctomycetaceae bacterium]|nr:chorismate mutase [Planctomycetaceae bacterium]
MAVRGIRGAITVDEDDAQQIQAATRELLEALLQANDISPDGYDEIVSAVFTTTPDLTSTFPAEAARSLGMKQVPLLCASEINVQSGMPRCVRVLLHLNTERRQAEMVHVYLREARKLRPDVSSAQ